MVETTVNPVGRVVAVPGLDALVAKMKDGWTGVKQGLARVPWSAVTNYLLKCFDDLIVYLVEHDIPGADKKATVMNAVGQVYDWVIAGMLPVYVRPFSGLIRGFVVNNLASAAVDWVVAKYNNGAWHPQPAASVLSLWGVPGGHRPE